MTEYRAVDYCLYECTMACFRQYHYIYGFVKANVFCFKSLSDIRRFNNKRLGTYNSVLDSIKL